MISREAGAEFLGTFVLMVFGLGSVAQAVLGGSSFGGFLSINLSWGIAVTLGVCIAGAVSGAHLNPAVTLALAVHRKFEWRKVPGYIAAQFAGAFVAAALVYVTYLEAMQVFDGGTRLVSGVGATAGIFATYPAPHLTVFPGGFLDQFVGTFGLMLVIFALGDPKNEAWAKYTGPLVVGLLVAVIGMAFGFNAGYAINPARDLGPRLFTAFAGWGKEVFTANQGWWWVPVVAPCCGAISAGFIYDFFLGERHPKPVARMQPALEVD